MRIMFILLIAISVTLQTMIAWYWREAPTVSEFENFFRSFYGEVPVWSSLAFAIGGYWFIVPMVTLIIMVATLVWGKRGKHIGKLASASFAVTIMMVYAMYPLHLMLAALQTGLFRA